MLPTFLLSFAPLSLAATAAAAAVVSSRAADSNSCAIVAKLTETSKDIAGQAAFDCLSSLPYDSNKGKSHITELRKYLQFHSTLNGSKNPPSNYPIGPIDIMDGLDKIASTTYKNLHEFDIAVYRLLASARDAHLSVRGCTLAPFNFFREKTLSSVSENGLDLPQIYMRSDLEAGSNISPISKIDNQDPIEYLDKLAALVSKHDPHAQWNDLYSSYAASAAVNGDISAGRGSFAEPPGGWPGAESTLIQFKNGTSFTINVRAIVLAPIASDPQTVFDKLCTPDAAADSPIKLDIRADTATAAAAAPELPVPTAGPDGYPPPFARDKYNDISGYHLDSETTVMFVPTFFTSPGAPLNQGAEVSRKAQEIVDTALATGRKKIIIDISGNGGGDVVRGLDLFRLFFPNIFPYTATRYRRHPAIDVGSKVGGEIIKKQPKLAAGDNLSWFGRVSPDQKTTFASFESFNGNTVQFGDSLTNLHAIFNYTTVSTAESPIRGFTGAVDQLNKTQPFPAENIIIVGDGACASTCTLFVNLMTNLGGVRSVVFGGRPKKEPMQIMGATRGSEVLQIKQISSILEIVKLMPSQFPDMFSSDDLKTIKDTFPLPPSKLPFKIAAGNVNFRNGYRQGKDDMPLQFEYQAADCRLFYTKQNILTPNTTWADAKKAIWGGGKCIEGSTGAQGSREFASKNGDKTSNNDGKAGGGKDEKKSDAQRMGITTMMLGVGMLLSLTFVF